MLVIEGINILLQTWIGDLMLFEYTNCFHISDVM